MKLNNVRGKTWDSMWGSVQVPVWRSVYGSVSYSAWVPVKVSAEDSVKGSAQFRNQIYSNMYYKLYQEKLNANRKRDNHHNN
jgi:hypothetical protein